MLTFVLNMDKSVDRWEAMQKAFLHENLVRVSGVEGALWENGKTEEDGRPQFDNEAKKSLVENGMMQESWYTVQPGELAVAMGHAKIWQQMIDDDIEIACILEDDTEPSEALKGKIQDSIEMPSDADVLFLSGTDQLFDWGYGITRPCTALDQQGRVQAAYGAHAYVITKQGAERALEATLPLHNHFPQQWWIGAFNGFGMFRTGCELKKNSGYAYGVKTGLVKHSKHAAKSLVTESGKKDWRIVKGL